MTNKKNMSLLEQYYNRFDEDHRLETKHGSVEFKTSIKYIEKYLSDNKNKKILDIGAGTGRYSTYFANNGYDVTAVELVQHNIDVLKSKISKVKVYQGNAMNLSMLKDDSFDIVLLFGPMYHLYSQEDKVIALKEAKRVLKADGIIFVAYCMNEYAVITQGFKKGHIIECFETNQIDSTFQCIPKEEFLYSYIRIDEINKINELANMERIQIIASDGPSNYMRPYLNAMNEKQFETFLDYHFQTCERMDLMGASAHTVDILKKK